MSEFITDEVKEAAAMALAYWDDGHVWNDLTEGNKNIYRRDVFHIIHAALPLLEKAIRADERRKCADEVEATTMAYIALHAGEFSRSETAVIISARTVIAAAIRARGE